MLKNILPRILLLSFFIVLSHHGEAQSLKEIKEAVSGLKMRGIGPAVMGGRIADIVVNPENPSTWYVAAGSGGVWKTTNSGITWKPVFDNQPSYSIGTLAIDPQNTNTVWVGTGENVSGRHVAWGDGIYKSTNGGASWQQMGLAKSEHIGRILIHPDNSDIILVAAEGPLWSSGGERGLYKSKDGGKTWNLVLAIDENTGVTDIEFDPSNPSVVYAAAYQRRRHVWSLLAGGPKSGIYKSTDNGDTWRRVTTGLPQGDMGKIGLAVTPANPNLVYATVEADNQEKGFYRSTDKGESWNKRSGYTSGGTGPHYYQEIEASPTDENVVIQMDVFMQVTRDGGKSFSYLETGRDKHSDNHALWIDPHNTEHLLAGTDGGLYESYDQGITWRHFPNLPISQFYKLALDNSLPFYNIVGGAQDLGTLLGPSRTMNAEGVRNQDWYIPLGADGYDTQFDPEDPNIVYMEIQNGLLYRHDRRTEEGINIQPQPGPNDEPERWNWDSPLLISPHDNTKIYFGSQRLWASNDKGNSWQPLSTDLTTNTNRYELEMMDRVWSIDALYDVGAMSKYATLTSVAESPVTQGVLYTGSDDGLIHVSEDGGKNWRRSASLPKVPERSFINDIEASHHNENTVFAVADAHKIGDYNPYIFMSTDRGKSWQSIAGDLPAGTIIWVLKQDHVNENLLFIGTEYGIYFSINKGANWIKLGAGAPTIAFRDLELHPRDNDIVGATFGRGFYILDDYTPLRELASAVDKKENVMFSIRDAWWYIPNVPMQAKGMPSQGSTTFVGENPPFGALITYYINEMPETSKAKRLEKEKDLKSQNANISFPGYDKLLKESMENEPQAMILILDENQKPIRWIKGPANKGINRTNWDLRISAPDPISLDQPDFRPPWASDPQGPLVAPGEYSAKLFILNNGTLKQQGAAQNFTVKETPNAPEGVDYEEVAEFQKQTSDLLRRISATGDKLREVRERLRYLREALFQTPEADQGLFNTVEQLEEKLVNLQIRLRGDLIRQRLDESTKPSISSRAGQVAYGHWGTRAMPTETQKRNIELAENDFENFRQDLNAYLTELSEYENKMKEAGAPYTKGREY